MVHGALYHAIVGGLFSLYILTCLSCSKQSRLHSLAILNPGEYSTTRPSNTSVSFRKTVVPSSSDTVVVEQVL